MTPDQRKAETERLKRICEENVRIAKLRRAQGTVPAQPAVDPLPAKSLASAEKAQRRGFVVSRKGEIVAQDIKSRAAGDKLD